MRKNRKGFTLAELLIVVAIIAVLVAIAIPIFTNQLEKSREATDVANVRSAYATLVAKYLEEGPLEEADASVEVTATQKIDNWQTDPAPKLRTMIDGVEAEITIPTNTDKYTVAIDEDGNVTVS